ncbi:DUF2514 family protein [Allopusillimonas ginsengisoli]|nr:DUF2514 family protein [Allopusillimonas ginsengisoli]
MFIRAQVIGGVVLLGVGFGTAWLAQGWRCGAKLANLRTDHAAVLEQQAQAVVASVQVAREIEQRRAAAVEQERDHAIEQTQTLAADVAASRAVSERLQRELGALRARYAGGNTAAAVRGQGEQGSDTIRVLIDMYTGLESAGRGVAEYADRLRITGLGCERAYDGIRKLSTKNGISYQ